MRKFKKKIIEEDLIIESNIENTEEKEDIETEHSFYISDEKFSISWDQPTNRCNRTHLSQTLEIKPGRYVYDVLVIDSENVVTKVVEGMVLVREGVTR